MIKDDIMLSKSFVVRFDLCFDFSQLIVQLIDVFVLVDDSVDDLDTIAELLSLDHQKIFGVLLEMILLGTSHDNYSFRIDINFSRVLEGFTVSIVARTLMLCPKERL